MTHLPYMLAGGPWPTRRGFLDAHAKRLEAVGDALHHLEDSIETLRANVPDESELPGALMAYADEAGEAIAVQAHRAGELLEYLDCTRDENAPDGCAWDREADVLHALVAAIEASGAILLGVAHRFASVNPDGSPRVPESDNR